jgi:hypothetical protein
MAASKYGLENGRAKESRYFTFWISPILSCGFWHVARSSSVTCLSDSFFE